ncbi:MAG: Bcr/CflA family multidrug efflux MFS transporter [Chloroflexi bacterium]|nr:Bcr/CflA family multidrug efflux MFS transporter [Chloroflexota bacterium]
MTIKTPDRRVKLVLLIGGLSAFAPLSIDLYLPALPSLTRDLGGTASLVQLTLTACLLGLAAGQLIAGPLSDSMGRRRPLLVGIAAYTLASFLCALASSVPVLVVFRLIQGMAGAAGIVIAQAVVRDVYEGSDVARFFALTMLISGLAPILGPVLGGQILRFTSWRGAFVFLAAMGVILLVASALGLSETLRPERRRSGGVRDTLITFRGLAADRVFMGYGLSSGLTLAALFTYISGVPFVLEDIYGISPQIFGLLFGANALSIVLLGQIGGRLVVRVGSRPLLIAGLGVAVAGSLLLLAAVLLNLGLAGVLPGFLLMVASVGLISPNATALALADHAHQAGSASALLGLLSFVVGAAVAPLAGLGGTHTAVPMAVVIVLLEGAAICAFAVLARTRQLQVIPGRISA